MLEVWFVLLVVSASCSLIGSLLVLKDQSMVADALSHSVLLGIVVGFFISRSLESPLLIVGATIFGVLSVFAIDLLHTKKIAHDAATGLVFSFFFAVAVILISIFARNVHLDMDMALMGEVLFAPLHREVIFGISLPVSLVKSSILLVVNVIFFVFFYQRIKLYVFDTTQARLSGISLKGLQALILVLVSLTTVLSFDAIGAMTVIAFLIAPSLTALPWARSFLQLLALSLGVGFLTVTSGYLLGLSFDLTMSGTCSFVSLLFLCLSVGGKKWGQMTARK